LNPDGTVLRERVLPDAASDIVEGNGLWVAGCRNNWVYAYSVDGEQVWRQSALRPLIFPLDLGAGLVG
jgi:outer membrane protein assembly factor BamB